MPLSEYVSEIRDLIGTRLLLLPGVTGVIMDSGGRYLLARHVAGDKWGFVGGGIEPLEDPKAALLREVREELGVEALVVRIIDSYGGVDLMDEYPNGDVVSYVTTAYICRLSEEPTAAEPDEVSDVGWFWPADITRLNRFSWIDRVIADVESNLNG